MKAADPTRADFLAISSTIKPGLQGIEFAVHVHPMLLECEASVILTGAGVRFGLSSDREYFVGVTIAATASGKPPRRAIAVYAEEDMAALRAIPGVVFIGMVKTPGRCA